MDLNGARVTFQIGSSAKKRTNNMILGKFQVRTYASVYWNVIRNSLSQDYLDVNVKGVQL